MTAPSLRKLAEEIQRCYEADLPTRSFALTDQTEHVEGLIRSALEQERLRWPEDGSGFIRDAAVATVDRIEGYTVEFAPSQSEHEELYAMAEEELRSALPELSELLGELAVAQAALHEIAHGAPTGHPYATADETLQEKVEQAKAALSSDAGRLAAELVESQAREAELREAVAEAREAIASLPEDSLGFVHDTWAATDGEVEEMVWPVRDELVYHLNKTLASPSPVAQAIGRVPRTLCLQCGPNAMIDEDGCCAICGATATGPWLEYVRVFSD